MGHGIFVTGTDTGVGKTLISTALLKIFAASGKSVVGMKPVAAGALLRDEVPYWEDVEALLAASNVTAPLAAVNPYALNAPLAPHIAAQREGIVIALGRIAAAYGELTRVADVVVVEGAGGFKVPLNERIDMSAIPVALGLPVILVVGLRLGCLNHALLTQDAITAAGLRFAGWVGNFIDPNMAAQEENIDCLRRKLSAPSLGIVPFMQDPSTEHTAACLSEAVREHCFPAG
jgi:dethiobiotin synthetase